MSNHIEGALPIAIRRARFGYSASLACAAAFANCPISSPCSIGPLKPYRGYHYQPFRSSRVAPLYAAPHSCEPLRAALPDLSSPQQGRPRLAGVAS